MNKRKNGFWLRRIIWLSVWILSVVVISNFGGAVSYGFFYGVTLLPIVSFLYLVMVFFFFKMYQKLDSRESVAGAKTNYFFILKNEFVIPFASVRVKLYSDFSYVENMKEDEEYELLRGDEYLFETEMVCKYRGEYPVGIKEVIITDFLRLFQLKYKPKSTIRAIVKPALTELSYIESIEEFLGIVEKANLQINTQQDVTVRDYVPGDPMRKISWKISAKATRLMVRTETGEEKNGVILLGDTGRFSNDEKIYIPLEHKMLELMGAIGVYLAKNNIAFTTHFFQGNDLSYHVEGLCNYNEYYDILCDVRFDENYSFSAYLSELLLSGKLYGGKVFFLAVHKMSIEMAESLNCLVQMGGVVVVYIVTNENCDELMQLANDKIKIVVLPVDADLEEHI